MSMAIEALREAYNEQKETAEDLADRVCELEVDLYHFRNMSVIDFMLFAVARALESVSIYPKMTPIDGPQE